MHVAILSNTEEKNGPREEKQASEKSSWWSLHYVFPLKFKALRKMYFVNFLCIHELANRTILAKLNNLYFEDFPSLIHKKFAVECG